MDAREGGANKEEEQAQCDAQAQTCIDGDEEAAHEGCQPHQEVHLAHLQGHKALVSYVAPGASDQLVRGSHMVSHMASGACAQILKDEAQGALHDFPSMHFRASCTVKT